jgi:hypothetical protein
MSDGGGSGMLFFIPAVKNFQIFIIAPLPLPKGYKIVSLIIN